MSASLAAGLMMTGRNLGSVFAASSCCSQIFLRDSQTLFNLRQAFLEQLRIVAKQQNAERRIAIDEHAAVAIEHGPARGDDGDGADSVPFGEVGKMVRLHDLQLPETDQEKHDEGRGKVGKQGQPALRDPLVVNVPRWQRNSCAAGRARPGVVRSPTGPKQRRIRFQPDWDSDCPRYHPAMRAASGPCRFGQRSSSELGIVSPGLHRGFAVSICKVFWRRRARVSGFFASRMASACSFLWVKLQTVPPGFGGRIFR